MAGSARIRWSDIKAVPSRLWGFKSLKAEQTQLDEIDTEKRSWVVIWELRWPRRLSRETGLSEDRRLESLLENKKGIVKLLNQKVVKISISHHVLCSLVWFNHDGFCMWTVHKLTVGVSLYLILAWYRTSSKDAGMPISGLWHCCNIRAVPIFASSTAVTSEH